MPKFNVYLWANFEADNWADAYRLADKIETALFHNGEVGIEDVGQIDVECCDEEYSEEEEGSYDPDLDMDTDDDLMYENISDN